jgi:hypothetical protein
MGRSGYIDTKFRTTTGQPGPDRVGTAAEMPVWTPYLTDSKQHLLAIATELQSGAGSGGLSATLVAI